MSEFFESPLHEELEAIMNTPVSDEELQQLIDESFDREVQLAEASDEDSFENWLEKNPR